MKKTYVYFLVPLLGIIIFAFPYRNTIANVEIVEKAKLDEKKKKAQDRVDEENGLRMLAIEDAKQANAARKEQREKKEEQDRKDLEEREALKNERDKAFTEVRRLTDDAKRKEKELAETKAEIDKLDVEKKQSIEEVAFLKTIVKKAETNVKALNDVLERIEAAEIAAAAAAKAAALAAKKQS